MMNTHRYTPENIASEKNLRFNIPLYQRLFAWGKEQVEDLMYDLKEHFASEDSHKPYFLGMLSCVNKGEAYDLIDGQQRFTVMMLIGSVLAEYYKPWKDFTDEGKRLRLTARPKDNELLVSVCSGAETYPDEDNGKMADAIACVREFMNREIAAEDRSSFARMVYEQLSFFFSELPGSYTQQPMSLNKYFEAMNAGGKGLEQHEILKVELLKGTANQSYLTKIWNLVSEMGTGLLKQGDHETEEQYRTRYAETICACMNGNVEAEVNRCNALADAEDDATIGDIKPQEPEMGKQGVVADSQEKSIVTFPEFLEIVLDIHSDLNHSSYYYKRNGLLTVFKENAITVADRRKFYEDLFFYRLLFDYYIITRENSSNGNMYDLIFGDDDKTENVRQYQSMLYVSQTSIFQWLRPLLKQLSQTNPKEMNSIRLLSMLKDIDNGLRGDVPDIESLSYNNGPDRYWFWRLDYYLWEQRDEYFQEEESRKVVADYAFRANRSLEHLHPQHQAYNTQWTEEEVNSFGNLAMISQSFNSKQSDAPVAEKFSRIAGQVQNHALQSLKLYRMYLDAKSAPEGWTPELMNKHKEQMYLLLKESFHK